MSLVVSFLYFIQKSIKLFFNSAFIIELFLGTFMDTIMLGFYLKSCPCQSFLTLATKFAEGEDLEDLKEEKQKEYLLCNAFI